jgi:hypothetical protein
MSVHSVWSSPTHPAREFPSAVQQVERPPNPHWSVHRSGEFHWKMGRVGLQEQPVIWDRVQGVDLISTELLDDPSRESKITIGELPYPLVHLGHSTGDAMRVYELAAHTVLPYYVQPLPIYRNLTSPPSEVQIQHLVMPLICR